MPQQNKKHPKKKTSAKRKPFPYHIILPCVTALAVVIALIVCFSLSMGKLTDAMSGLSQNMINTPQGGLMLDPNAEQYKGSYVAEAQGGSIAIPGFDTLNEYLVVYLDNIMTKLSGDAIVLENFDGMSCTFNIYTQDKDGGNKKQVTTTDRIMALFRMGETEACSGGTITLTPNLTGGLSSGTYKGTLHFVVEVKSEFDIAS